MGSSTKTRSEKFLRKVSTIAKGRTKPTTAQVFAVAGISHQRRALSDRGVRMANRMSERVRCFLPHAEPQLIGDFVSNLESLWEAGHELDSIVKEICGLRYPADRERLRDLLTVIEVKQMYYPQLWIRWLGKSLPKLQEALDLGDRPKRSRTR